MAEEKQTVIVRLAAGVDRPVYLAVELPEDQVKELKIAHVDMKVVEEKKDFSKKGFVFLAPVLAGIPSAATIIGAATLGVVSGAAGTVGRKVAEEKIWPKDKPKPETKTEEPKVEEKVEEPELELEPKEEVKETLKEKRKVIRKPVRSKDKPSPFYPDKFKD